ncbi:MAG: phosphatidylserine decarboxylase [Phycisphaerales bacterium]|nr:phosphatidylserine decarboxylase [Phycisphaerales bacterium]
MFAPYARTEVFVTAAVGAGAALATALYAGPLWSILPVAAAAALLSFYRDPHRTPPARKDVLIAPADGRIVDISRIPPTDGSPPLLSITIFLSVMNVHLNRSPCAGRVLAVDYRPGRFLNALDPASNRENESNRVDFEPAAPLPGPVSIRQIAGLLARRIVCAVRPGDSVALGQRVGMIKLGSRTELCAVDDGGWIVEVKIGDVVRGAETIMLSRKAG